MRTNYQILLKSPPPKLTGWIDPCLELCLMFKVAICLEVCVLLLQG